MTELRGVCLTAVLLCSMLLTQDLGAESGKAQEMVETARELKAAAQLRAVQAGQARSELRAFSDPAEAAARAVLLIARWGHEEAHTEAALDRLRAIAHAGEGTNVARMALYYQARLLHRLGRQGDAFALLSELALSATAEMRRMRQQQSTEGKLKAYEERLKAREKELSGHLERAARERESAVEKLEEHEAALRAQEEELAAHQRRLQEQAHELQRYAEQLKAQQQRLRHQQELLSVERERKGEARKEAAGAGEEHHR